MNDNRLLIPSPSAALRAGYARDLLIRLPNHAGKIPRVACPERSRRARDEVFRWPSGSWHLFAISVVLLLAACQDSIVRLLGPENDPQTVITPERFQFTATEMRNVNDRLVWTWPNSASKAALAHDSFIHHGYGILVVLDAGGQVVDSTLLELNLETETRPGAPGNWTLILVLASARGRANFTLTPKP
jgi:hypothetical protein